MSAIPKHLLIKARNCEQTIKKEYYISNPSTFSLNETTELNLDKIKSKRSYSLFINKSGSSQGQTGPTKWSKNLSMNEDTWKHLEKCFQICEEDMQRK